MKISIRDRAFAHSPVSNGPMPPMGVESPIEWDRELRDDSPPNTHIYTDGCIWGAPKQSVAWMIEPCHENNRKLYDELLNNGSRFQEIWTADREILEANPKNAKFLTNAGCWIRPEDRKIWPKSKNISTIASNKRGGTGYDMRHEAIRRFPQIDAFGPEYRQLSGESQHHKIDALRDYRFHLVIENCRRDYFFSEKLIDCFMTGTVPIYWGCPSIGDYFNTKGMVTIDSLESLETTLGFLWGIEEEVSVSMYESSCDNFERAKAYCLTEDYIVRNLLS